MAIFNWSEQPDGAILAFAPGTDQFIFDDLDISAAAVFLETLTGAQTVLSYGGKSLTLNASPYALTTINVTFADGSMIVVGDNTIGTTNDGAASAVSGGAGDDLLIGGGGNDSVSGGAGDDVIVLGDPVTGGAYGNDTLDGGAGSDRLVYVDDAGFGVLVNLGTGADTAPGENYGQFTGGNAIGGDGNPGSFLTLRGIEAVTGTPYDDVFNGNNASLVTGGSDDIRQRFEGGGGDDAINGATGNGRVTVAEYGNAPSGIAVDLAASTATDGEGGTDTLVNVDGVIGTAYGDTITGGGGSRNFAGQYAELYEGRDGDDVINGGPGNDTLDGGGGHDTLTGGDGDDAYFVSSMGTAGPGRIVFVPDPVTEGVAGGADTVTSNASYTLPGTVENLVLTGAPFWRAYAGIGNALDNRIEGQGDARHFLDGGVGADTLDGGGGNDVLIWDAADALVNGGTGTDILRIAGSGETLDLTALAGGVLQGIEIIDLTGSGTNTLALTTLDLLDLSDSTNTLRVDGDAGDGVTSAVQGWVAGGTVEVFPSVFYQSYTDGAAILLLDPDIVAASSIT